MTPSEPVATPSRAATRGLGRRWRLDFASSGLALAVALAGFWIATAPGALLPSELPAHQVDVANGRVIFHAASCLACHRPDERAGHDRTLPSGTQASLFWLFLRRVRPNRRACHETGRTPDVGNALARKSRAARRGESAAATLQGGAIRTP